MGGIEPATFKSEGQYHIPLTTAGQESLIGNHKWHDADNELISFKQHSQIIKLGVLRCKFVRVRTNDVTHLTL